METKTIYEWYLGVDEEQEMYLVIDENKDGDRTAILEFRKNNQLCFARLLVNDDKYK